jgi:hypothetical protein
MSYCREWYLNSIGRFKPEPDFVRAAKVTIDQEINDFNDLFKGAITWADERINDNDIEYELRQDANSDNGKLSIPDVSNWVACDERLPENLQTVWLANKEKQWVCLGCLVDTNEGWHWAESNGVIYVDEGKIVSECESDDLNVTHWCALPDPPCC